MAASGARACRVLVVDDDPDVLDATCRALEDAGYEVARATDGALACAMLEHHEPPQVIVLDLMMPVVDGWTVLRQLRDSDRLRATAVIVMSAGGRDTKAVLPDGVPFLRKPLDLPHLISLVRAASGR